jgi:hypothetical protein
VLLARLILIDWFFALLFRPDIVKISPDSETAPNGRERLKAGSGLP